MADAKDYTHRRLEEAREANARANAAALEAMREAEGEIDPREAELRYMLSWLSWALGRGDLPTTPPPRGLTIPGSWNR